MLFRSSPLVKSDISCPGKEMASDAPATPRAMCLSRMAWMRSLEMPTIVFLSLMSPENGAVIIFATVVHKFV